MIGLLFQQFGNLSNRVKVLDLQCAAIGLNQSAKVLDRTSVCIEVGQRFDLVLRGETLRITLDHVSIFLNRKTVGFLVDHCCTQRTLFMRVGDLLEGRQGGIESTLFCLEEISNDSATISIGNGVRLIRFSK